MNYMILPLKRYADFSGRSRRMELWMFVLFQIIVSWVVGFVVNMIFPPAIPAYDPTDPAAAMAAMSSAMDAYYSSPSFIVSCILGLFFLIPSLAVGARRLHDQDKSGWLLLLGLIPILGALILLVFYLLPGTVGPNRYGEDPKQAD